jgi:cytochrome b6-f complex iron-sulfur subunit
MKMPDEKSGPEEQNAEELNRRQFFVKMGMTSMLIGAAGTAVFAYQFLAPNVLYEPSPIVNAGKPDRYPPGSVTLDPETGIYVVHGPEGYYALSATCTHLGCLTAFRPDLEFKGIKGIIACPCHGSKFDPQDGRKVDGPAPKPLPWLRMWLNDDGELMVDRSAPITSKQMVRV